MVVGGEYGLGEATQGIAKLDLREQEILDMEVARRLQEEEVKVRGQFFFFFFFLVFNLFIFINTLLLRDHPCHNHTVILPLVIQLPPFKKIYIYLFFYMHLVTAAS